MAGPTLIFAWLIGTAGLSLWAAAAHVPFSKGDSVRDPRFRGWLAVAALIWLVLQAAGLAALLA